MRAGRRIVLLDLDGTLTKSDNGIISSVKYAYQKAGIAVPSAHELQSFIGPAIQDSMLKHGVSQTQLPQMVQYYRHAYTTPLFDDLQNPGQHIPGMYLNRVYDGMFDALTAMKSAGDDLFVCTAKPEFQSIPICRHFGILSYVNGVYGASSDMSRIKKDQIVQYALEKLHFDRSSDCAVMVGDRWTDIEGARKGGHLDTIGAQWGYAYPGEFEKYHCYTTAASPADLPLVVAKYFADHVAPQHSEA